jgi:hypothetical protein
MSAEDGLADQVKLIQRVGEFDEVFVGEDRRRAPR